MINKVVHFTGSNYEDVLKVVPSYLRSKGTTISLHIFIPFKGDIVITKNCYIINHNNDIQIIND